MISKNIGIDDMENLVYHYTSIEALIKMLHIPDEIEKKMIEANNESGYGYYLTFHATDAYMMNDRMEHKLILDIVDKLIPKKLRSQYNHEITSVGKPYVVSFCSERDYIPMWKIYPQQNTGVCLQFDLNNNNIEILKSINSDREIHTNYICFNECKYKTPADLKAYVKTQIKEIESEYKCLPDGQISQNYPFHTLYKDAILYKGTEWSYEKEWRLIWWCNHNKIKSGKYGATSYQEIKIPLRFLKEILISPSSNQEPVQYGLQEWLKANDLHRLKQYGIDIQISRSSSSLR